jgi:DNA-binding transcriptional LysR family regulator
MGALRRKRGDGRRRANVRHEMAAGELDASAATRGTRGDGLQPLPGGGLDLEGQNFTRAAGALNVAQSALSQQILGLERELGVTLFHRTTRRVELTETGSELLGQARRAVQAFDATRVHARELASGEAGRLRLGFVASAAYGLLPRLLLAHRRAHPQVRIELRELTTTQQVDALAAAAAPARLCRAEPRAVHHAAGSTPRVSPC